MRATLTSGAALLAALTLLAGGTARAADDDVPSFKKPPAKEKEKGFVTEVGTAILKAARLDPTKIELDSYKIKDVKGKKHRKELEITMNWDGRVSSRVTKKKFASTIVVHLDVSDDKEWEVLNIEYSDDNKISPAKPNVAKIQELIKKFNR
jgi:hypothetical protein